MGTTYYAPVCHLNLPEMPHSTRQSIPLHWYMHMPYIPVPVDHEHLHSRTIHHSWPYYNIPVCHGCHIHYQYVNYAKHGIIHVRLIHLAPRDHSLTDNVVHCKTRLHRISMDYHHYDLA